MLNDPSRTMTTSRLGGGAILASHGAFSHGDAIPRTISRMRPMRRSMSRNCSRKIFLRVRSETFRNCIAPQSRTSNRRRLSKWTMGGIARAARPARSAGARKPIPRLYLPLAALQCNAASGLLPEHPDPEAEDLVLVPRPLADREPEVDGQRD